MLCDPKTELGKTTVLNVILPQSFPVEQSHRLDKMSLALRSDSVAHNKELATPGLKTS